MLNFYVWHVYIRLLNTAYYQSEWPTSLSTSLSCKRLWVQILVETNIFILKFSLVYLSSQLHRSPYKWNQAWHFIQSNRCIRDTCTCSYNILKDCSVLYEFRATDKARKSVITHRKSIKTHLKNKQCVKIRINISQYALGVQSSAYWLSKLTRKQNWCPFVCLSTHCQWFPSHYKFYYKNTCLQLIPQEVANRYQSYI